MATTTPTAPTNTLAPRDRTNEKAPDPNKPVVEGVVNPNPKAYDPANPAGAPKIESASSGDDKRQAARDELVGLLGKDTSSLTDDQKKAHHRRVHELHYLADGQEAPKR